MKMTIPFLHSSASRDVGSAITTWAHHQAAQRGSP